MKHLFLLFIFFFSVQIYAADRDDYWIHKQVATGYDRTNTNKIIYGEGHRIISENKYPISGADKESARNLVRRSIAVDKPTIGKVGLPMLKRLASPQALLGTAAISALLGAIGWVMEDGVYVKKIPLDDDPNSEYIWITGGWTQSIAETYQQSGSKFADAYCSAYGYGQCYVKSYKVNSLTSVDVEVLKISNDMRIGTFSAEKKPNPNYDPKKDPKTKTVPLTAPLLGAAMLGKDYKDPDPKFDNSRVNTDVWTSVKETYEKDPTGTGNETADDFDTRIKNAPPTPDGKPAPIEDPRYSNNPSNDDDKTNDRSWDEKGDEAKGDIDSKKDPVTGEDTGNKSITLQFPVFCEWAFSVCKWYDDWKASDKVYKDHIKKTEDHQSSEKTFWTKVTDFFKWAKDESDTDNEEPQEPDTTVLDRDFDTKFEVNAQCPPNPKIEFPIVGPVELGFNKICDFFSFLKFGVLTASSMLACWIVSSAVRGGE